MNRFTQFNSDDYEDKTCCGIMEHLEANGFKVPFERPLSIDKKGLMVVNDWAIHCFKMTSAGNISTKNKTIMYLSFCPFCGQKLRDD